MAKTPEPNFICDASGFKFPRSEARRQWNGLLVHKKFWEPRQPQDFIPPVSPPKPVPNARPWNGAVYEYVTDRDIF